LKKEKNTIKQKKRKENEKNFSHYFNFIF